MSALENLASDFGWFPSFLKEFAELAPLLGLVWAIYTYFSQRKQDREAELRKLRTQLYVDFVSSIDNAEVGGATVSGAAAKKHFEVLSKKVALIQLQAPQFVLTATLNFFREELIYVSSKVNVPIPDLQVDIDRSLLDNLKANNAAGLVDRLKETMGARNEARKKLIESMRLDLSDSIDAGS